MSWWQTILLVLGGLAGTALLLTWAARGVYKVATDHLRNRGICAFCNESPATLVIKTEDGGPPLIGCEPCFKRKLAPVPLDWAIEAGRVSPWKLDAAGKPEVSP